jgi:hypothetical protein
MNWELILTVFIFAVMLAVFLPLYLVSLSSYHKMKLEAMVELMEKTDKKIQDHNFDIALKNMFNEGVENE